MTNFEIAMKKLIAAALLGSAAATAAQAQSDRYYGALDYGTLNMSGGGGSWSSPGALTLSGGYQYLSNVALEVGLTLIGSASADVPGSGQVSVSQTLLSAVVLGSMPVNNSFRIFGKAGLGLHNGEINGVPDDLIFGFGGQYLLNSKVSLRLQYENLGRAKISATAGRADLSRLSFGATYVF